MGGHVTVDTDRLVAVAREELACLWYDLHEARMYAINGKWSMKCDSLVERIKDLTLLVGPTPWEEIQIPLLGLGIYQRVHAELGIDVSEVQPDMERVAGVRAGLDARSAAIRPGVG
jgi:hypothetical protein